LGEATGETRRIVEPLLTTDGEQQHGRLHDHGHDGPQMPEASASGPPDATGKAMMPKGP